MPPALFRNGPETKSCFPWGLLLNLLKDLRSAPGDAYSSGLKIIWEGSFGLPALRALVLRTADLGERSLICTVLLRGAARPEENVLYMAACVSCPGTESWNLIKHISYIPGLQLSHPALFRGSAGIPKQAMLSPSSVCSAGEPCCWSTAFTRLTLISHTKTTAPLRADSVNLNSVTGFFCFTTAENHLLPQSG